MRRSLCFFMLALTALTAGILFFHVRTVSAQNKLSPKWTPPPPSTQPAGTAYNPYPAGILPADLVSEIARVRREIQFIFNQAVGEWQALPPFNVTGQPPTLQGSGYQAVITIGKLMNFDENLSPFRNRASAL